eukprot:TRINITY_DN7550_c0_g1_i1.p1 TRINITY_DN7550_c0_g1~~TRINITY_DN7550_c0_g1_i1.p1  ORF type:complete len:239 (+),score=45.86 TRINITY_DN7550_c0_g1_i1:63-779(+)
MELLFEKREYPNGAVQFVPVQQIFPGRAYFTQQIDQNNQVFYVEKKDQTVTTTTIMPGIPTPGVYVPPQQTIITQTVVGTGEYGTPLSIFEVNNFNALVLGIIITSIFFPVLIYLIGFPFIHAAAKRFAGKLTPTPPEVTTKLNALLGVGWTTWVFHLALLISLCTFWIGIYCTSGYYSPGYYDYTYSYYYPGYYSYGYCYSSAAIAPGLFGFLVFVFNITSVALGADYATALKKYAA